ncbi:RibD family protein [Verrucomicrobia bacterium]|nr:RibD family protein [Verrucomicrobiota bacterium]
MPGSLHSKQRPWIALNMAMTADGKVSGPRERRASIDAKTSMQHMSEFGSPRDHARLLRIRASMDGVICGRHTIESGAIDLGPGPGKYIKLRKKNGLSPYNRRIIVSASGQVDLQCRVFQEDFSPILIATTETGKAACEKPFSTMPWIKIHSFGDSQIDWGKLTCWLKKHWNIHRMVLEGGGMLNDGFFRHSLVDEIFLTICPVLFGGKSNATISDGVGIPNLSDATRFRCVEHKCIQGEMFLRYLAVKTD